MDDLRMPECAASWIQYKDPARIARIQQELVQVYEHDFSKHHGKVNSGPILMVFRSITTRLARERAVPAGTPLIF